MSEQDKPLSPEEEQATLLGEIALKRKILNPDDPSALDSLTIHALPELLQVQSPQETLGTLRFMNDVLDDVMRRISEGESKAQTPRRPLRQRRERKQ